MNIKVVLEYDGSGFAGWQQQARGRTVEAELKRALRELTGDEHKVYAAGRTDAGAHAEGQVVSFQMDGRITPQRLVAALNARLPEDVSVLTAEVVPDEFHARYSARWRRYRYRYLDRRARPALERGRCWHVGGPLDVDSDVGGGEGARRQARLDQLLLGLRAARRRGCARCAPPGWRGEEISSSWSWWRRASSAGLARSIAGALAEVGRGRKPPEWVGEVLAARDRRLAARTAPAGGLTLMEVIY